MIKFGRTDTKYVSVQFSHSVVSDSLQPHGPQHTRPPRPSLTPGVYSNSCPLSRWCHPTISSSVISFSSCLQSLPASGSFQMSQLFAWSFSFNISPSNEHPGLISFRMDWLDLLAVQGTLKSLLQHHSSKASILPCSAFFIEWFYEDLQDLLELIPKEWYPFHYRGVECKSRKSRNIWSNRQIWPWSTEWRRAKANSIFPRECTGHSKHPLPTT